MKLDRLQIKLALALLLAAAPCALPQGTFVNLDFESAMIIPLPTDPHLVAISNALPGWTAYRNYAGDNILYDTLSLGAAAISIQDSNGSIHVLQGNYTVLLQPSFPGGAVVPAIGQVGTIPSGSRSITLYAEGSPVLSFAGQPVPLFVLAATPNYSIFGGDVTALANHTGELLFTGNASLDNIAFSAEAIPEPGAVALIALGLAAVAIGRRGAPPVSNSISDGL